MRHPVDYGDNFPVPSSHSWNPAVPWRFPMSDVRRKQANKQLLPWLMLGVGLSLGIAFMVFRQNQTVPSEVSGWQAPAEEPMSKPVQPKLKISVKKRVA